jgi:hypothetical protein
MMIGAVSIVLYLIASFFAAIFGATKERDVAMLAFGLWLVIFIAAAGLQVAS